MKLIGRCRNFPHPFHPHPYSTPLGIPFAEVSSCPLADPGKSGQDCTTVMSKPAVAPAAPRIQPGARFPKSGHLQDGLLPPLYPPPGSRPPDGSGTAQAATAVSAWPCPPKPLHPGKTLMVYVPSALCTPPTTQQGCSPNLSLVAT